MLVRTIAVLLLVSLTGNAMAFARAGAPTATHSDSLAYRELVRVDRFGFSGFGIGGRPSLGELAVREIVRMPTASTQLQRAFNQGTLAAKLYVLAGWRVSDHLAYNEARQELQRDAATVTTFRGCMREQRSVTAVVAEIDEGRYDVYFSKSQQPGTDSFIVTLSREKERLRRMHWAFKHMSAKQTQKEPAVIDSLVADAYDGTADPTMPKRSDRTLPLRAPTASGKHSPVPSSAARHPRRLPHE